MTCTNCLIGLVASRTWRAWSLEERRESGKREKCGEHCSACYHRRRRGQLERKTWKLEDLLEEAEHLFKDGSRPQEVASRLGVNRVTLVNAYQRGRVKGITTRKLTYTEMRTK